MPMDTSKVALITGGSSGIGKAAAARLLAAGMRVVICGRSAEKLENAIVELQPDSSRFHAIQADVTHSGQVEQMVASVLNRFGQIDVLVNSAGAGYLGPFVDTADETISRLLEVNVAGVMRVTRAVLPGMIERKSGMIVNLCGVLGVKTIANAALYCAAKHAVAGFSGALAQEVRRQNIRVTSLCCSGVDTPFWEGVPGKPRPEMLLSADDVALEIARLVELPPHAVINQVLLQHVSHQL